MTKNTAAAAAQLDRAGWRRAGEWRAKAGRTLSFDILVPSTSTVRKRYAEALQAAWRPLGVEASVTAVDFPVFQERLAEGDFDSYIGRPTGEGVVTVGSVAGTACLEGSASFWEDARFLAERGGLLRDDDGGVVAGSIAVLKLNKPCGCTLTCPLTLCGKGTPTSLISISSDCPSQRNWLGPIVNWCASR